MTHQLTLEFTQQYSLIWGYYEGHFNNSCNLMDFTKEKLESFINNKADLEHDIKREIIINSYGSGIDEYLLYELLNALEYCNEYIEEYLTISENIAMFNDVCELPVELYSMIRDIVV